ncbi:nucleotidyltransferase family protein [Novosphingobium sp. MW5]|nr:nucleotidyltransferase family protein [Novosphingobium sp. MW5]
MAGEHLDLVDLLLLRIAAGAGSALDGAIGRLQASDWLKLAQRAIAFRLGPLLAQAVADHGWPTPADAKALLERDRRENALRALSQQRTLASLASRMNRHGMAHAVLKGGALVLGQAADRPVLRIMRDIDVLLSPSDAESLHSDLRSHGWAVPPGYLREAGPDSHHLAVLADPENGNLVELHIRLTKAARPAGAALGERILRDAVTVSCLGGEVRITDPASNFLHLLAHATLNRPFDPGPQFLADISGLARDARLDPEALAAEARSAGLERALGLTIGLLDNLAPLPDGKWRGLIPPETKDQLPAAMAALLHRQDRDRELRFREEFAGRGSSASWLVAGLARAFSPRAEALAAIAGRQPDDPLRYLAYPRWIAQRISSMAKARFDPGIRSETARADVLKDWLSVGTEGGRR